MTPWLYRMVQSVLAPGAAGHLARLSGSGNRTGLRLDVGCGPRLAIGPAIGVDLCFDFAASFRDAGGLAVVADARALPFPDGSFESVWSVGMLHHMTDRDAAAAIGEMRRITSSHGETVVFDAVVPDPAWKRPLAWLIRRCDRGSWMRREAELGALLSAGWHRRRVTYAWTGLEALYCRCSREELNPSAHR